MSDNNDSDKSRREFLQTAATAAAGSQLIGIGPAMAAEPAAKPLSFTSRAGHKIPFSREELHKRGGLRVFEGRYLNEIAFPLGGIGTGNVSLGGRGQLRDWEIFNRPNKGGRLPFTFVTLWAKAQGAAPLTRVLESAPAPPYTGADGYIRTQGAGLPHLESARFFGSYPIARLEFTDAKLPVRIELEAFTPFNPLNVDDSGIPCAILRYRFHSVAKAPVELAAAFSMLNPVGYDGTSKLGGRNHGTLGMNFCEFASGPGYSALKFSSRKYAADHPRFGTMALLSDSNEASYLPHWADGEWWDDYHEWWDEFHETGRFAKPPEPRVTKDGVSDIATLAPRLNLLPGATKDLTFVLAWHFPVRENYWNGEKEYKGKRFRNDYATRFADAWAVAQKVREDLPRLEGATRAFARTWNETTLPAVVLDAASSQASIVRTNTCLFAEGRQFFAFEGCNDDSGCCPMNCTHVWNYVQAVAFLFPELERSARQTDFLHNLKPDGAMAFRSLIPLGEKLWGFKPAADGQFGTVMKAYREWQMSGDDDFLRRLWPGIKRAVEYAWKQWDADRDGVMEGEQHNTYDIEFYGPNPMTGALYLGGLRAAARMAAAAGDSEAAETYARLATDGAARLDRELWNGDYYIQKYDPAAHRKYQFGQGCLSDQVLGQWFASVIGLGYLLPAEHVHRAVDSIFRFNFTAGFQDFGNPQRIYALNDEKALLVCSWPRGHRPPLPFVYSDEAWTGIEYHVAAHLIYEGFVDEGLAVVKGVRDRYDGFRRNPWNEVECGNHYARAMSSWSLLLALTGFQYSAPEKSIAFGPLVNREAFQAFFSAGSGWGRFQQKANATGVRATLEVQQGSVRLREFRLKPLRHHPDAVTCRVGRDKVPAAFATRDGLLVATFDHDLEVKPGAPLSVDFHIPTARV